MKTIFVSSTFNDMQFERDAIRNITTPLVNAAAMKYGESVSFCDLRWGINTTNLESEEGAQKVLDVCLDEIDRCRPYMVVILGERYGWIPNPNTIKDAANKKDLFLQDLEISVTALEIEYGSLGNNCDLDKTLFYFRVFDDVAQDESSVEDSIRRRKLSELKKRINILTDGRVRYYSVKCNGANMDGIDSFAHTLAEDVSALLEKEWKEKEGLSHFEKDRLAHDLFVRENSSLVCVHQKLIYNILGDIQSHKKLIRIDGKCGSGKSVLLSNLSTLLAKKYDVLFYSCGYTPMSSHYFDFFMASLII